VVLAGEESAAALSFRNLARVCVLTPEDVGVADIVGAASLLVSQAALDGLTARANAAPKTDATPIKTPKAAVEGSVKEAA
jgi:large subunit ribosomal protein L4